MLTIGIDVSRALRADRTGTERYAWELSRRLVQKRRLGAQRVSFRLYADRAPTPGERRTYPGAEWVVLERPRLWTHLALGPELRRRPPDIFFEPAHVLPLHHPATSIVTVHDLGYEYYPETRTPFQRWYLRLTTRWHVHAARHILADSAATRDDLTRWYNAAPQKIDVVYPGVDHDRFKPVRDEQALHVVRAKYRTSPHYALFVGTIHPRKNLERLVRAFATIVDRVPNTTLVLAGEEGRLVDKLKNFVESLGIRAQIRFPGYIDEADLSALLSGAAGFVYPSLFEGFGLPVLEAQACGTPVLTSTSSSLPEVAGNAAILVDPLDVDAIAAGLYQLLNDEALRRELVRRGTKNSRRFTWEGATAQIWRSMQKLLGDSC